MRVKLLFLFVIILILISGIAIYNQMMNIRPGAITITFVFDPDPICENGRIKGYIKSTTFNFPLSRRSFFLLEIDGKDILNQITMEREIRYNERTLLFDYDCDGYCSGNHTITAASAGSIYTFEVECYERVL